MDFSAFRGEGSYRIVAGGIESPVFPINRRVWDGTADFVLNYMRQQRCGFNPFQRDSCHTKDAYVRYHPEKEGQRIDVTGGWHDAADLLQYTTTSANLMLREIGLALFLASVGIKAGANFVDTVVDGDGLTYVWCGFIITVLPILVMGVIARKWAKINYCTLMGLIAGSTTDPPALAFANQTAGNDAPAVGYSTVYPLSMFLRILTAQLIILLLCVA